MTIPWVACLLLAAALAPALVAAFGGDDVEALGHRLDFFRWQGPALAALAVALLSPVLAGGGRGRGLRGAALVAVAVAVAIVWTGGFRMEGLSMRTPDRSAQIACLLALLALVRSRAQLSPRRALAVLLAGGLLGGALFGALRTLDHRALRARIAAAAPDATGPDVIVLLTDTLRADALGFMGAGPLEFMDPAVEGRSPSPFLDALAARSVVFERAISQAPWTVPSVAGLLSSLYPSAYMMARKDLEYLGGGLHRLPPGLPWLPARLREAGYHTAGFQKNPLLKPGTRFERGFDHYEWVRGATAEHESAAELVDAVVRWADAWVAHREAGGRGSFFLYVHFMDPHVEYRPPPEYLGDLTAGYDGGIDGGSKSIARIEKGSKGPTEADLIQLRGRYGAEVRYLDDQIRRLHEALSRRGLWGDETVVAWAADHGEQFHEHGAFRHRHTHIENVHVPLVLSAPKLGPARVRDWVGLIDVAPTLLEILGLPPFDPSEGRSLLPLVRGEPLAPRTLVTDGVVPKDVRVTDGEWALVRIDERDALYDLSRDPREARDLAAERPDVVERLRTRLAEHRARLRPFEPDPDAPDDEGPELDADTRERLRALGYVE